MHEELSRLAVYYLIRHDVKEERVTLAQRLIALLGTVCLVVLLLIAVTWPTGANAQAQSPNECMLLADYGVTTRALVISGVDLAKRLEILGHMYTLGDERIKGLAIIVRKAADKSDLKAGDFASRVFQTCMDRGGDISGLLGPSS